MSSTRQRRKRTTTALAIFAFGLILLAGTTQARANGNEATAAHQTHQGYLHVEVVGDVLTVNARSVVIDEILAEISRKIGLSIISEYELTERTSVHFARRPLPEALRLILRHRSFALRHANPESGIIHAKQMPAGTLWVLYEDPKGETRRKRSPNTVSNQIDSGIETHQIALNDPSFRLRLQAVIDLADIGGNEAIPPLTFALVDNHQDVRVEAVSALADIGTEEAAAALATALRDEQPEVQEEAVWALADIGGGTSIRLLEETLSHEDKELREAAIQGLADIGDDASARALGVALHDLDPSLREATVDALGDIGTETAIAALRQALADGDPVIRDAAADNLAELSSPYSRLK